MVSSCCAYGCTNRFKKDSRIHFHRFPTDVELRKRWLQAIRRKDFKPSKTTLICSEHFTESDYIIESEYKRKLKCDAVPSVFTAFPSYLQPPAKKRKPYKEAQKTPLIQASPEDTMSNPIPSTSFQHSEEIWEDIEIITDVGLGGNDEMDLNVGLGGNSEMDLELVEAEETVLGIADLSEDKASQTEEKALPLYLKKMKKDEFTLKRKIKILQQKVRRRNKRIGSLKELVHSLKNKGLASDDFQNLLLSEFSGMSKEIFLNARRNTTVSRGGQRYSQELKKFALTLYYSSPKAYKFCRPLLKLPHPSSLANWISNVHVQPGFLENVFQRLKELDGNSKDCNLVIDGMAIRKQILFCNSEKKFVGYCDYGDALVEGPEVPATEALVFMLVGLKSKWKWPIGYFLQNKSSATIQASLIKSTIHLSKQAGLRIHGITFDGTSTNLATLNSLGCNFYGDIGELQPEFTFNNQKYSAIPDPCHMLKLARNCLATLGKLKSPQGIIDWSFIKKLHTLQNSVGLKFANKLSRAHIEWGLNRMKVKLAAQTLSKSIADAIEFLDKEGIVGFQDSDETVKFIRMIDRLFDFLNSRNPFEKGSKSAITVSNYESLSRDMLSIVEYLYSLTTCENVPLYQSHRKTFVIGFAAAVKSILSVSKSLLNDGDKFKYVLTYKFSQDHIETFFSKIRQRHGFNNNPNVQQFKWAIRQILLRNEISASALGNSLFSDSDPAGSVFEISWKKRKVEESFDELEEEEDELDIDVTCPVSGENSMLKDSILYYICGFIVRKIIKNIPCLDCKTSLVLDKEDCTHITREHTQLVHIKDLGGLVYVSEDVFRTVQLAEKVLFIGMNRENIHKFDRNFMTKCIIFVKNELSQQNVFQKCQDVSDFRCHKLELIKLVCQLYFKIRLNAFAKLQSEIVSTTSRRQWHNKLTLFLNQ